MGKILTLYKEKNNLKPSQSVRFFVLSAARSLQPSTRPGIFTMCKRMNVMPLINLVHSPFIVIGWKRTLWVGVKQVESAATFLHQIFYSNKFNNIRDFKGCFELSAFPFKRLLSIHMVCVLSFRLFIIYTMQQMSAIFFQITILYEE